jgi:hypothetical protein
MLRRRAGEPVPDDLLPRVMAAVSAERQRPTRRRPAAVGRLERSRWVPLVGHATWLLLVVAIVVVLATESGRALILADAPGSVPPVPASGVLGSSGFPDATDEQPAAVGDPTMGSATFLTPTELRPGALAVVTRDGDRLRVRLLPGLGSDSRLLVPLLRTGTHLFVAGGPVEADGYTWFLVQPDTKAGTPFGWVAVGRSGEVWLRPRVVACPATAGVDALAGMSPFEAVACFGSRPITIEATVRHVAARDVGADCALAGGNGVCVEGPSWLLPEPGALSVELDATAPHGRSLGMHVRPADRDRFSALAPGRRLRVTGTFDAPEARECRVTDADGQDLVPRDEVILACRTRFVVNAVEPAD